MLFYDERGCIYDYELTIPDLRRQNGKIQISQVSVSVQPPPMGGKISSPILIQIEACKYAPCSDGEGSCNWSALV